jgi:hypothetical protein
VPAPAEEQVVQEGAPMEGSAPTEADPMQMLM